jgi:Rieske Fe-S protein
MDQTRRQILKFIAAAPLTLTFGFAGEGLMRFAKPSMKPFGFFDPADMPTGTGKEVFSVKDFPAPWTCIPFMYRMKITELNQERHVFRDIPAFAIRLTGPEIVAYSRICPRDGGILYYRANPRNCGCHKELTRCCGCAIEADSPVLVCSNDLSVFDLAHGGRVIQGPAPRPPRKFQLDRDGDRIAVVSLELGAIS